MNFDNNTNLTVPVLPLRGLVVFPKTLIHFDVGRKKSITAINKAMKSNQYIFLAAQRNPADSEPTLLDFIYGRRNCKSCSGFKAA